jgi:PAS domain
MMRESAGREFSRWTLSKTSSPSFDELRTLAEVVWLWDSARGRIVWANAAGVAFFGCESLFDLIDRPFDPNEPGVERVMELSQSLQLGQMETVELLFPSAGHGNPISCNCVVHALADGRDGVLVVGVRQEPAKPGISLEKLDQAFELLPQAAAFMGQNGALRRFNAAAVVLFNPQTCTSLGALLGSAALGDDLLSRLSLSGTVSDIRRIDTKIGQRDMRLTLRRLGLAADDSAYAMALLDDITERRALERQSHGRGTRPPDGHGRAGRVSSPGRDSWPVRFRPSCGAEAQANCHSRRDHRRNRKNRRRCRDCPGAATSLCEWQGARDAGLCDL